MVVPAMAAHQGGTTGSLIKRRVKASTTCLAFSPPHMTTTTTSEPAATGFALRLTCHLTKYIRAGAHGEEKVCWYRSAAGGGAEAICLAVPDDEDGVRDALRGMLRSVRALQGMGLTEREWESIVPEDVVPGLADPQARARHGGAEVHLAVVQHVRFDVATALMAACKKKIGGGIDDDDDVECSVCYGALMLRGPGEEAVELPGCAHAFHRRCISQWFDRKSTCPLCRGDVVEHLDPDLQKHIAEFADDDAT